MASWKGFFGGAAKVGKLVWAHPEVLQVIAASTGHAGLAAGIGTVVAAGQVTKQPSEPAQPTSSVPPPVEPVAPVAQPEPPVTPMPEVDMVGKWRGTLDRMSMQILNHKMTEDELYNNARLLESGDVAGVEKNLRSKL